MRRLTSLAFVLLLALAMATGCRGASVPSSGPIYLGVVLPQTGGLAADGAAWVRAVRLAADEVNAAGGILGGRRIELLVADSATAATAGVSGAQTVLGNGAVAIIGDGGSDGSLAIYQMVTQMRGVVQVSGSATSISLTTENAMLPASERYFFRTAPPDGYQAQVVVQIATDLNPGMTPTRSCHDLGILFQDDAYGRPLAQSIATLFAMHGTVAAMVSFTPDQADYMTETAMMHDATPDCVALITYPRDAGTILRDWEMQGFAAVQWIGTDGLFSSDFLAEAASATLIAGFLGASPLTTPNTPEFMDFAARYDTAYGHAPENFTASYYDATALVLLAIERAGSTDGAMIRDSLRAIGGSGGAQVEHAAGLLEALTELQAAAPRTINYQGASGPITFDANGDTVAPYEIWSVSGTPAAFGQVAVVQATDLTMTP